MASTYPTTLDALTTSYADDGTIVIHAAMVTDVADAVNKIEAELGTLPKGGSATVKARIAATETVANAAVPKSLVTTAGDLLYATGSAVLARLGIGTATQVLGGGASAPAWVTPPGAELAYAEITSNSSITQTVEASANTVVSAGAVSFDGATSVIIEFFSDDVQKGTTSISVFLFDGSTSLGFLAFTQAAHGPMLLRRKITPSNASHTYSVRAIVDAGTGNVGAGAGGAGVSLPAYIRITKA